MAGRLRPRLRVADRKLLTLLAHDMTETMTHRSALVIAPHPDDETIGCGITIAAKAATGTAVRVVIVTDGSRGHAADDPSNHDDILAQREAECLEAVRRLGIGPDAVDFLGIPDLEAADHTASIERDLRRIVDEFQPQEVYAPFRVDNHPDHRAVGQVVDRLRDKGLPRSDVFAYPIWLWNRWAWTSPEQARYRQNLDLIVRPVHHTLTAHPRSVSAGECADRKRAAMDAYASQTATLDPEWLAMFFGSAELFFALQQGR